MSKSFGSVEAVRDFTVDVYPGATGVFGPNGAGKTTFFNLVIGYIRPSRGSIEILGLDPWRDYVSLRSRLGVMVEDMYLPHHLTGAEALETHARVYGVRDPSGYVYGLAEEVGLEWALDRRIGTYSQGMYRRLCFIHALLNPNAELLVLDEPFSNVDVENVLTIIDILRRRLRSGVSLLISSHIPAYLDLLCERYIFMNSGRLARYGAIGEVIELLPRVKYAVRTDNPQHLAHLVSEKMESIVSSIEISGGNLVIETPRPDRFVTELPRLSGEGPRLLEIRILEDTYSTLWREGDEEIRG